MKFSAKKFICSIKGHQYTQFESAGLKGISSRWVKVSYCDRCHKKQLFIKFTQNTGSKIQMELDDTYLHYHEYCLPKFDDLRLATDEEIKNYTPEQILFYKKNKRV